MLTALGVLGTIFIAKAAFRALRCRAGYGGGCGAYHMHRHMARHFGRHLRFQRRWGEFGPPWARGPIDLGDVDDLDDTGVMSRNAPLIDVQQRIDEVFRGLELNTRQAAEAGDVVSILRSSIGPRFSAATEVLLALRAAGKTPFDTDLADAALGPRLEGPAGREARDALEHLHNILTEDQRATLLRLLPRPL